MGKSRTDRVLCRTCNCVLSRYHVKRHRLSAKHRDLVAASGVDLPCDRVLRQFLIGLTRASFHGWERRKYDECRNEG